MPELSESESNAVKHALLVGRINAHLDEDEREVRQIFADLASNPMERALAESHLTLIDRDRKVISRHAPAYPTRTSSCCRCCFDSYPCPDVRDLAEARGVEL